MNSGESYLDIVWRQFHKNAPARFALWAVIPLALLAIFAPLIASDRPFVFFDGKENLYPWLRDLFNPEQGSDYFFNMALLGFFPWLCLALVTNRRAKRAEVPGRRRALVAASQFVGAVLLLSAVFAYSGPGKIRPDNRYKSRSFSAEGFHSLGSKWGVYTLIAFGPNEQDTNSIYRPPFYRAPADQWRESNDGAVHLLGTDDTGRDVLVRMIYGTRISLTVGFVAVGISATIGIIVGALAGYFGGKLDMVISRVIEIVLLFPVFFLILTLVALIGKSIYIVMAVIGLTSWPTMARLVRGEVLKQRSIDYTVAARALGASHLRVAFRHILPNALSPVLVAVPFGIAGAIITEAGLSLLGYGVEPPTPTWGALLKLGNGNYHYWWLVIVPALGIFFTVTVLNLVGSGLRDAMDPKLRV